MSAEALGEDLLGEVKEEGLDEFLSSLRALDTSSSTFLAPTGVPALDQLLGVFQHAGHHHHHHHHRQQQQQQQQQAHNNNNHVFVQIQHLPPVLEITGISASSGKTQLLCHLITLALLPHAHDRLLLHGKCSAVVLLDLSGRFSVLRLRDVMRAYIQDCVSNSSSTITSTSSSSSSSPSPPSHAEIKSLIRESLLHLHIFYPQSSSSVLATLASLPSYLLTQPHLHSSAHRRISHLVLHDLGAFLWQDRLKEMTTNTATSTSTNETSRSTNNNNNNNSTPPLILQYHRTLISSLRSIQSLLSCQITTTSTSLATPFSIDGTSTHHHHHHNHLALRPHLPTIWTNFRTAQIVLERAPVPKFRPGISAQEAESERAERLNKTTAVGEGVGEGVGEEVGVGVGVGVGEGVVMVLAWVNWWGSEEWRDDVREGVRRWERDWKGGLRFCIGEGVRVGVGVRSEGEGVRSEGEGAGWGG